MQTKNGVFFKTYGKNNGHALIFLHGYLESSAIWDDFAPMFSDEYFVVCPDLPGHGRSPIPGGTPGLEKMAVGVIEVADHLGVTKFNLAGHSMGGYLLMAMLEKYNERINSAIMIHSTCYADSDEKKSNREREIDLIKRGKKELIFNTSIPRLYANLNLEKMAMQVGKSMKIALSTSDSGIIYALNAMKNRPDRAHLLSDSHVPVLLVGGKRDNLIPFETMEKMKALSPKLTLACLENSGHMGFIEEPIILADELKRFLNATFECQ